MRLTRLNQTFHEIINNLGEEDWDEVQNKNKNKHKRTRKDDKKMKKNKNKKMKKNCYDTIQS